MYRTIISAAVICVLGSVSFVQAETFSIDEDSMAPFAPDAILTPGPTVHIPGLGLGDDLNALSSGIDKGTIIYFSVEDKADVGVTSNQFGTFTPPMGHNTLMITDRNLGLTGDDDLDALNFDEFDLLPGTITDPGDQIPDRNVYYSLGLGSPSIGIGGVSADDILMTAPDMTTSIYVDGSTMGLTDGDDLDALALLDAETPGLADAPSDSALFSLAAGSPTLDANSLSGADILYTEFDGSYSLFATSDMMGLDNLADVNALEVQSVPEPLSMTLIGIGLLGLTARRRKRS